MSRRIQWILILLGMGLWLLTASCNGENGDTDGGECANPCETYADCGDTEDCVECCCRRAIPSRCSHDSTCQPGGLCVDGRCVGLCINDTDCCTDVSLCIHGFCEPYPTGVWEALSAPPPDEGRTEKQPLQVGIGDVPLDFPIGVSMAGYGARPGPHNPYRKTLGGSERVWDKPRVKAYVLDNGLKRVVIVRTATGWSTDYMVSHVAWRLYQETGHNYINRIVTSANHTHSYPGRFSFWIPDRSMGVLGHGDYSQEIQHRHTKAIADAILAAIDDLQPARIGYTYVAEMDPERKVHRYRRGEYQTEMDDSLVTVRIDDDQGNPRALLFNFGLHGTHTNDTAVSGDAPGAVEIIAEQNLQHLTGLPVKATFLSGNSGDISPAGDGSGLDDWRKIQEVGHQAWPILRAQFDALEGRTTSDVDLDIASIRAPVNREALGYGPGEFIDEDGNEYLFGAFQCVPTGDEDPDTVWEDGALGCIFSTEMLSGGVPVPGFCKFRMNALKINDLGFITVPGEPMSNYGRGLAQALLDEGFAVGHVLGYSQDHHLYIMHADNWLQGDYEPSMGIWGWAEGDYFFGKGVEMIQRLVAEGGFEEDNGMLPSWYEWIDDTVPPTPTDPAEAGTMLIDAPAEVERVSMVTLRWTGGHPGVDLPRMGLERDDSGTWTPVTNAAGTPYSCDLHSSMIWYLGDYEADHTWELSWEEKIDFPAGTYRIRVDGNFHDGGGTQEYTATSSTFEFKPSTRLVVTGIEFNGDQVSGVVFYPNGPTTDDGVSEFDELEPLGYLHHTGVVPPFMPYPVPTDGSVVVDVSIEPPSGPPALEMTGVPVDTSGQFDYAYVRSRDAEGVESFDQRTLPSSHFSATPGDVSAPGTYSVTVTATDGHGNTGGATVQIEVN